MLKKELLDKLDRLAKRYGELERELSKPEIVRDLKRYKELSREHKELAEIYETYREYRKALEELREAKGLLKSPDLEIRQLAEEEVEHLQRRTSELEERLKLLLVPRDPNDSRNVILEIRAGTGGEEAALFAADLFRMYQKYAEEKGWKVTILNSNRTGLGGFKAEDPRNRIGGKDSHLHRHGCSTSRSG